MCFWDKKRYSDISLIITSKYRGANWLHYFNNQEKKIRINKQQSSTHLRSNYEEL